jgi:hypothetical protein
MHLHSGLVRPGRSRRVIACQHLTMSRHTHVTMFTQTPKPASQRLQRPHWRAQVCACVRVCVCVCVCVSHTVGSERGATAQPCMARTAAQPCAASTRKAPSEQVVRLALACLPTPPTHPTPLYTHTHARTHTMSLHAQTSWSVCWASCVSRQRLWPRTGAWCCLRPPGAVCVCTRARALRQCLVQGRA